MSDGWEMMRDPRTIVFVHGHEAGCPNKDNCDCAERYVDLFNRCPECGAELDKWGECPDEQEHWT